MAKMPRNVSGADLCKLLNKFGYQIKRRHGSHIRLISNFKNYPHAITIPDHDPIKIGTLNKIIKDVADYLEMRKEKLVQDIFSK